MIRSSAIVLAIFSYATIGCGDAAFAQTPPKPDSAREVVARQVEAVNAHDTDAVTKFHAPDATIFAFPSGNVLAHGSRAIHAFFASAFAKSPRFQLALTKQLLAGNVVINSYTVSRGPTPELVSMYEVAGEAIEREWLVIPASASR